MKVKYLAEPTPEYTERKKWSDWATLMENDRITALWAHTWGAVNADGQGIPDYPPNPHVVYYVARNAGLQVQ